MWSITGPFDQNPADKKTLDPNITKTKRLLPGHSYLVSREATHLVLNSKFVPHGTSVTFTVADCTGQEKSDPNLTPELSCLAQTKKVSFRPELAAAPVNMDPDTTRILETGNVVLVGSNKMIVKWDPVVCYFKQPRGDDRLDEEAYLGIGVFLVESPEATATYHVTDTVDVTPSNINALVSPLGSPFVTRAWLDRLLADNSRLCLHKLPLPLSSLTSVEQQFTVPDFNDFVPPFAASLKPEEKNIALWAYSDERARLFFKRRFLFVGEHGRELDKTVKCVVERAGGKVEVFDAASGRNKFGLALRKAKKACKNLVLVAEKTSVTTAIGEEAWTELTHEADAQSMRFIQPKRILYAILHQDISHVDCSNEQPLPVMSNEELPPPSIAISEEASAPRPAARKKLPPRRKVTRDPTPPASPPPADKEVSEATLDSALDFLPPPPPRRAPTSKLVSRTRTKTYVGVDDPSMSSMGEIAMGETIEPSPKDEPVLNEFGFVEMPNTIKPRAKTLKRSRGTDSGPTQAGSSAVDISISIIEEEEEEPAYKRHKGLMDKTQKEEILMLSDGDEAEGEDVVDENYRFSAAKTQQQQTQLGAVAEEEEEETQSQGVAVIHGMKRKAASTWDDDDLRMDVAEDGPGPSSKRRAVENVNAVQPVKTRGASKPPSTLKAKATAPASGPPPRATSKAHAPAPAVPDKASKTGASPGKPDTDAAFLKALASTKKGKKTEDQFDRDFNKLKISKPTLGGAQEPDEDDYAVLGDFGKDVENVRGNFMNIVMMPHYERKEAQGPTIRHDWQGKPDFKKFVKKGTAGAPKAKRPPIVLYAPEENDYGMGAAYWPKGSKKPAAKAGPSKSQNEEPFMQVDDEEDEDEELVKPIKATKSRTATQTQATQSRKGKARAFAVESDSADEDDIPAPPKKKARSRSGSAVPVRSTRGTKTQPLFLDEDEDIKEEDEEEEGFEMSLVDEPLTQTLRSTRVSSRAPTQRGKPAPVIIIDDDSDDGATFKGFGKKKGKR